MARIRTIKPDFWTDEKIVEISAWARLLFIGLWNFADDEGRMIYSPKKIKLQILPADDVDIENLLAELRRIPLISIYSVDGVEYLQVINFAKHQKVDKRSPSKLPPPNPAEFLRIPPTEKEMEMEKEEEYTFLEDSEGSQPAKPLDPPPEPEIDPNELAEAWNEQLGAVLPKVTLPLTPKRRDKAKARIREHPDIGWWRDLFFRIASNRFLTGHNERGWKATWDWLMANSDNALKVLEGKYSGGTGPPRKALEPENFDNVDYSVGAF